MSTRKKLCITFLFLLIFTYLPAQIVDKANYKGFQSGHAIYHWTTSNGLPQSHISGIVQTHNHLIWIATYNGVVSFDGRKFTPVDLNASQKGLSSFITAIQAFGDTIVWTTPQEIVFYHDYKIVSVYPIQETDVYITRIQFYRNKFYFSGAKRIYYLENRQLVPLMRTTNDRRLKGHLIRSVVFTRNELICLSVNEAKKTFLYIYNYTTKERRQIPTAIPYNKIQLLDNSLAALSENRWFLLNKNFVPTKLLHQFDIHPEKGRLQSFAENRCFTYYNRSELIIGRNNQTHRINTSLLMYGNEIYAHYIDRSGNLWLGTNSLGLFMLRQYPFRLFNFQNNDPVTNSSCAYADNEGLLWFDSENKHVLATDRKTGQIRQRMTDLGCWAIAPWSEDTLVFFTYGAAHHWYNKRTHALTRVENIPIPITNYLCTQPGNFILASEGMLYRWNGKKLSLLKKFRSQRTSCNQLLRIGNNGYYFATSEGLYIEQNNTWKLITGRSLINNSDFRSLYRVKHTPYLLIGTNQSGVLRYHMQTGKLEKLANVPAQLKSCWSMVEDRFGQLWITSNNGIVQLFPEDLMQSFDQQQNLLVLNHYRYENGLDNVEFNSRTANKSSLLPDGDILFSSLGGPVIVHPKSYRNDPSTIGNLLIERIFVNSKSRDVGNTSLQLREADFVQIQFTLPAFSTESVFNFEYRIKGYRNSWAPVFSRMITLDNLPPGNYQLEIRTNYGHRKLNLPVQVKEAEPNSWIANMLIITAVILVIIFITVRITKRVQEKKHALTVLKQQLKLLEMEALRSQMNPHFIFNCLNTIQFLFISGNVARANKYLANFSALMRMILDLLREPITTLDLELRATKLYIELEQLQFDNGFDFRLVNNLTTQINCIRIPSLFFQVFVENAILHGLRKTDQRRPVLTIILEESEDGFVFRVCDNGPGIDHQKKEDHTSVGMKLLRDRFALKSEIYNWHMDFIIHEHETIHDDIKTEIIITFGKVLLESSENEYLDRR